MTPKQFFDWQTSGGTDDVMCLIDCLEKGDVTWCAIDGILMRVASLEDTLQGKIAAWKDTERRQSVASRSKRLPTETKTFCGADKKIKDLGDIARLVESHPHLWNQLGKELQAVINRPPKTVG